MVMGLGVLTNLTKNLYYIILLSSEKKYKTKKKTTLAQVSEIWVTWMFSL